MSIKKQMGTCCGKHKSGNKCSKCHHLHQPYLRGYNICGSTLNKRCPDCNHYHHARYDGRPDPTAACGEVLTHKFTPTREPIYKTEWVDNDTETTTLTTAQNQVIANPTQTTVTTSVPHQVPYTETYTEYVQETYSVPSQYNGMSGYTAYATRTVPVTKTRTAYRTEYSNETNTHCDTTYSTSSGYTQQRKIPIKRFKQTIIGYKDIPSAHDVCLCFKNKCQCHIVKTNIWGDFVLEDGTHY